MIFERGASWTSIKEMNMGRHKDIGVKEEGITLFVFLQDPQINLVILIRLETFAPLFPRAII
jgi:hypothetical protein